MSHERLNREGGGRPSDVPPDLPPPPRFGSGVKRNEEAEARVRFYREGADLFVTLRRLAEKVLEDLTDPPVRR